MSKLHKLALKLISLEVKATEWEKALGLQAKEYERRLDALNHAHEQQVERNAAYVSREIWGAEKKSLDLRLEALDEVSDRRLQDLENWRARVTGIYIGIAACAGLVGGVVAAIITRFVK